MISSKPASSESTHEALLMLLSGLREAGYQFVTPNTGVISHNRRRRRDVPPDLAGIFGWSLPFLPSEGPAWLKDEKFAPLFEFGETWRSLVRVSTVAGRLFAHSSFPTNDKNAVFLGPDSYRFARVIAQYAPSRTPARVLDVGCGAGVGALIAADLWPSAQVAACDVNPAALALTRANTQAAGRRIETVLCRDLPDDLGDFDLILANPPFISDRSERIYRDGGGEVGLETTIRWAKQAAERLNLGGAALLYSASPIETGGQDPLWRALTLGCSANCRLTYEEVDPDVFSGLLSQPAYQGCERIAAIAARIDRFA